jgi:hypothetical protein
VLFLFGLYLEDDELFIIGLVLFCLSSLHFLHILDSIPFGLNLQSWSSLAVKFVHLPQNISPHLLQWCLRLISVKGLLQSAQLDTSESGFQWFFEGGPVTNDDGVG